MTLQGLNIKFATYILITVFLAAMNGCAGPPKKTGNRSNGIYGQDLTESRQLDSFSQKTKPDYINLATQLINQGFYEVAIVQLENAKKKVKKASDNVQLYFLMGKCFRETKQYAVAEKNFKKAVAVKPDYAPAYNGLGLVYDMTGKRSKARQFYHKAIGLNPARADFHNNLGFSLLISKKYKEAKNYLFKSIALAPDFIKAKNNLALCCVMTGEDQKAINILKSNFSIKAAYCNMGALYMLKGDKKKADEMYEKAK